MDRILMESIINLEQLPADIRQRVLSRQITAGSVDKLVEAIDRIYHEISNQEQKIIASKELGEISVINMTEQIRHLNGVHQEILETLYCIRPRDLQKIDLLSVVHAIVKLHALLNLDSEETESNCVLSCSFNYLLLMADALDPKICKIDRLSEVPKIAGQLDLSVSVEDDISRIHVFKNLLQQIADTVELELNVKKAKVSSKEMTLEEYLEELKMLFQIDSDIVEFKKLRSNAKTSIEAAITDYINQNDFFAAFILAKKMDVIIGNPTDYVFDLISRKRNSALSELEPMQTGLDALIQFLETNPPTVSKTGTQKSQIDLLITTNLLDISTRLSIIQKLSESAYSEYVLNTLNKIDLDENKVKPLIIIRKIVAAKEQLLANMAVAAELAEIETSAVTCVPKPAMTPSPPPIPRSESLQSSTLPREAQRRAILRA